MQTSPRWIGCLLAVMVLQLALLAVGCGGGGDSGSGSSSGGVTSSSGGSTSGSSSSSSGGVSPEVVQAGLQELNSLRALAGLPAVTENPSFSTGDQLHAVYMVKNNVLQHFEEPGNPYYTAEGNAAAIHGALYATTAPTLAIGTAIDILMAAPFHGIAFIDPRLRQTGFGLYSESRSGIQSAAAVDVGRGVGDVAAGVTFPILWPGPGTTTPLYRFTGSETPDPLTSLPGFVAPTGPPIYIELGPGNVVPNVTAYSLKVNGVGVTVGEIDQTNYTNPDAGAQASGRAILQQRSAIVLLPRDPFPAGATVEVSVTVNGQTLSWTFSVSTSPRSVRAEGLVR